MKIIMLMLFFLFSTIAGASTSWCYKIDTDDNLSGQFKVLDSNSWQLDSEGKKVYNPNNAVNTQKRNVSNFQGVMNIVNVYNLAKRFVGKSDSSGSFDNDGNASGHVILNQDFYYKCDNPKQKSYQLSVGDARFVLLSEDNGQKYIYSCTEISCMNFGSLVARINEILKENESLPPSQHSDPLEGTGWRFTSITNTGSEISIGDGSFKVKNECSGDNCLIRTFYNPSEFISNELTDRAYSALETNPSFQQLKSNLESSEMQKKLTDTRELMKIEGSCFLGVGESVNNVDSSGKVDLECTRVRLDDSGNPVLDNDGNPIMETYSKSYNIGDQQNCTVNNECVKEELVEEKFDRGCFAPYDLEEYVVDKNAPFGSCALKQKKGLFKCKSKRITDTKACEVMRKRDIKSCDVKSFYEPKFNFIPGYVPNAGSTSNPQTVLYSSPPSFPLEESVFKNTSSINHQVCHITSRDGARCRAYTKAEVVPDLYAYNNDLLLIRVGSRGQRSGSWQTVKSVYIDLSRTDVGGFLRTEKGFDVYGAKSNSLIDLGSFTYSLQEKDYKGDFNGGYSTRNYTGYAHWALKVNQCQSVEGDSISDLDISSGEQVLNMYEHRCDIDFVGNWTTASNHEWDYNEDTDDWAKWECPPDTQHYGTSSISSYQKFKSVYREAAEQTYYQRDGVITGPFLIGARPYQKGGCYKNVQEHSFYLQIPGDILDGGMWFYETQTVKKGDFIQEPTLTMEFPISWRFMDDSDVVANNDPMKGYTPFPRVEITLNSENKCKDLAAKDPRN